MRKNVRKLSITVVIFVTLFLLALAPTSGLAAEKQKNEIYIGVIEGITGWLSFMGEVYDGIKLATKDMNANGGMAGKYPIKLVAKDTRSETPPIIPATKEFISDGVDIILGGDLAEQVIAIGMISAPKGIPVISPANSTPTGPLMVPNGMGFTYTISDNLMSAALAQYAIEKGYKTVYLMGSPDDPYFEMIPLYFAEVFEKMGGKVIGQGTFSYEQTEFSVEVSKIKKLNPQPDLIFDSNCCGGLASFVKRLRSEGIKTPYWGPDSHDDPAFFALGAPAEGVVFCSAGVVTPENPPMVNFAAKYKKAYGKDLESAIPALGYELMLMLEQAVIKAGEVDPVKIRDAWASMKDFKAPIGSGSTVTFAGTNGNPIRDVAICIVENGKKKFLKWVRPEPQDIPKPR